MEVNPIGVGLLILGVVASFIIERLRRRARTSGSPQFLARPNETWKGHPMWVEVEQNEVDGGEPTGGLAEIAVASPAHLLIRRRSWFPWRVSSFPRIDVPAVRQTLDVRGDDAEFANRLFADSVMVKTLPLALKGGGEIDISPGSVRVRSGAVDGVAKDAIEAARATAMAVVSALNLPPPGQT